VSLTAPGALKCISLFGCIDNSDPNAPDGARFRLSGYEGENGEPRTIVTSPDIALLGIQVVGPEFEEPLLYQIPMTGGVSTEPLSLPAKSGYELRVLGYDVYGEQTFEGKASLEYVRLGENRPFAVELNPLGNGERATATFELVGEERYPADLRLVIEADRNEIGEGQSVQLRAYGVDSKGNRIDLDPELIHWAIEDPRGGRLDFDPARSGTTDPVFYASQNHASSALRRLFATSGWSWTWYNLPVLPNPYVDLSAGAFVTCGVRAWGDLYCWGTNESAFDSGMLGLGSMLPPGLCNYHPCSVRPIAVAGGWSYSAVSVGKSHVCALEKGTGFAICWGSNRYGELGLNTTGGSINVPTHVRPPLLPGPMPCCQRPGANTIAASSANGQPVAFRSISAGYGETCALTSAGDEYCWGADFGALPVKQAGSRTASTGAAAFTCRMDGGGVWCDRDPPGNQMLSWKFLGQATTAHHVCAISTADKTWCWGYPNSNNLGKLGNGTPVSGRTPVDFSGGTILNSVATGSEHSCGLAGTVAFCWGHNAHGELGINNNLTSSSAPMQVTNGPSTPAWAKISTGYMHTCALDTSGSIWCWGRNLYGELGIGPQFDTAGAPHFGFYLAPKRVVGS
jgi:alpha-tubulin suppressor-like RCC1 family protein